MTRQQFWSTGEVAQMAGLSHDRIARWARTGALSVANPRRIRSGTHHQFTCSDVLALLVLAGVVDAGMFDGQPDRSVLWAITRAARNCPDSIVVVDRIVIGVRDREIPQILAGLKPCQVLTVIPVTPLAERLAA